MVWLLALGVLAVAACIAAVTCCLRTRRQLQSRVEALEREAHAAALRENQTRQTWELLLAELRQGVLLLDSRLRIVAANEAAVRLLDLVSGKLEGRLLEQACVGADLPALLRRAQAEQNPLEAEIRRLGPGGGAVTARITPAPGGCWLVTADDLTDRRRLEDLRRDFVGNVSHELRTPMAAIRAMAETLRDGALEDPEHAYGFLDTILAECDRLTRIADDLLILSDAETNPPDRRPLDLSDLCRYVLEGLRPQAERAGLTLETHLEPGVAILGDRDDMDQVLVNLVDNAIKYTPPGGKIQVSLRADGDQAVLTVTDTGIGMMQEHLPRIFERFYRVDKARSRQSGGTGLGLSIVKHMVEAHEGSVSVESEYTRGSTFTVRIPLLQDEARTAQSAHAGQL